MHCSYIASSSEPNSFRASLGFPMQAYPRSITTTCAFVHVWNAANNSCDWQGEQNLFTSRYPLAQKSISLWVWDKSAVVYAVWVYRLKWKGGCQQNRAPHIGSILCLCNIDLQWLPVCFWMEFVSTVKLRLCEIQVLLLSVIMTL